MTKREPILARVFPVIADLIHKIHAKHRRYVMRDELASALLKNRSMNLLLRNRKEMARKSMFERAGNIVDWFSAHFRRKSPLVSQWLEEFDRRDIFRKAAYIPKGADELLPQELPEGNYWEGRAVRVWVNRYERDRNAAAACKEYYGTSCIVCNFDFGVEFGEFGQGFIEVHHLKPLSSVKKSYRVDPINDLRPLCPNCHAMAHRSGKVLTIDELVRLRKQAASKRKK